MEETIQEIFEHLHDKSMRIRGQNEGTAFVGEAAEMTGSVIHIMRQSNSTYCGWAQSREAISSQPECPFREAPGTPIGYNLTKFVGAGRFEVVEMIENILRNGKLPLRFVKLYRAPGHFRVDQDGAECKLEIPPQ